jgi:membrane protein
LRFPARIKQWLAWLAALARAFFAAGWAWSNDRCATMSAALAFYAAFSLAPMLVIVIAIAGFFFGADAVQGRLFAEIQYLVGSDGASVIQTTVSNAWKARSAGGNWAAPLSVVAIVMGASATFAELNASLNRIWDVRGPAKQVSWLALLRIRMVSFALVVGLGFLLLVLLIADAALAFAASYLWRLSSASLLLGQVFQSIFSILFLATAFGVLMKILPDRPIRWPDAALGGTAAALLFVGGKGLFAFYLSRAGTANTFGAAGALAVILMWLFYSAAVFLFGAELSAAWARRNGPVPLPAQI